MNTLVTTSWDDGHVLDLRVAELLSKYSLQGTFYISPQCREIPLHRRLNDSQIQELSREFEIGAHTMTHPRLTDISEYEARQEIGSSKVHLEQSTGKGVESFCYPGGYFAHRHQAIVREAGFILARGVRRFATQVDSDAFALPTTMQAYHHFSDALPILLRSRSRFFRHYFNWDELAIALFERVVEKGGVFHIWGHSWEVEDNNDWGRLERVLKHIAHRPGVSYLANKVLAPLV